MSAEILNVWRTEVVREDNTILRGTIQESKTIDGQGTKFTYILYTSIYKIGTWAPPLGWSDDWHSSAKIAKQKFKKEFGITDRLSWELI